MKNKKGKILKIVLASMMVFSCCFASNAVAEEMTTKGAYFTNPYVSVEDHDIVDTNNYNNKTQPQFVKSTDNTGSNLSNGANEGQVWTNKKIEDVSTSSNPGRFRITLQARGFRFRGVDDDNNKISNKWYNPLADNSTFTFTEEIDPNFHLVDGTLEETVKTGFSSRTNVTINDGNKVGISFNENKLNSSYYGYDYRDGGISFDVEVTFEVQINKNVGGGEYNTKDATSTFTPKTSNFYYYEWGTKTTDYSFHGINWNNSKNDLSSINEFGEITLMNGHKLTIDKSFFKSGGTEGRYPSGTPTKDNSNYYWKEVTQSDLTNNSTLGNIEKFYFYGYTSGYNSNKVLNLRFEIKVDGEWIVLEPINKLGNNGGNHMTETFKLGQVISKTDPLVRENAGLVNGVKTDTFDNHGYIKLSEKEIDIDNMIEVNKTATNKDWDARTYDVNITASSLVEQEEEVNPVDVVLAIDKSLSMEFPSKLKKVDDTQYNLQGLKNAFTSSYSKFDKKTTYYTIINPSSDAGVYRIFYDDGYWQIVRADYSDGQASSLSQFQSYTSEKMYVYTVEDAKQRLDYVKDAAATFVGSLADMSRDNQIGLVTFHGTASVQQNIVSLTERNEASLISTINSITTRNASGTNQTDAINKAVGMLDKNNSEHEKFIILLTDGTPTSTSESEIKRAAQNAKNKGYTLITLGVSLGDVESAKKLLQDIASEGFSANKFSYELSYNSEYPDELDKAFNDIISSVSGTTLSKVTIKDYIDPRFNLLNEDGKIAKNGDVVKGGTVHVENGETYIVWTDQEVSKKNGDIVGWRKTITLQAKDDFIGGNIITTNTEKSEVIVPIGDGNNGTSKEFTVKLPMPTVNVKELSGVSDVKEETYFLGEEINPDEIIKALQTHENTSNISYLKVSDTINQLLTNGTGEMGYTYEGTNDEVGKLKLSIVKSYDETHKTEKVGNHVETYQLVLTYEPYRYDARDASVNKGYDRPKDTTNVSNTFDIVNNTAYINVEAGSITVCKRIDKYTNSETQGDPIFRFRITNEDTGETFEKFIRFNDKNVNEILVTFENLSQGTWIVEELDTIRYELYLIQNGSGVSYDPSTVIKQELNKDNKIGAFKFFNKLINDESISDTDIVQNNFSVDENGKVTISPDYGEDRSNNN